MQVAALSQTNIQLKIGRCERALKRWIMNFNLTRYEIRAHDLF